MKKKQEKYISNWKYLEIKKLKRKINYVWLIITYYDNFPNISSQDIRQKYIRYLLRFWEIFLFLNPKKL